MSTLAKVFVVIVLICSALLAASSATLFTLRTDYKQKFEDTEERLTSQIEGYKNDIAKLEKNVETLKDKNAALSEDLTKFEGLETKLRTVQNEFAETRAQLLTQINLKDQNLDALSKQIAALNKKNEDLRSELKELQGRNEMLAQEVKSKREELIACRQQRETFKQEVDRLIAENRRLATRVENLLAQVEGGAAEPVTDQPKINAVVIRADEEPQEFVVISAGSDDGVKVGMQFVIYRRTGGGGTQYVGMVDVTNVEPEFAICKIQQNMRARGPEGDVISFRDKDLATTQIGAVASK